MTSNRNFATGKAAHARGSAALSPELAALFEQARRARAQGVLDAAVSWLGQIVQQRPDFGPAQLELGLARLAVGDDADAERALLKAVSVLPNEPQVWSALAELTRRQGRAQEEIHCLEQLLKLTPAQLQTLQRLLGLHTRHNDLDTVMGTLDRIERHFPGVWVRLQRAEVLKGSGKLADAETLYAALMTERPVPDQAVASWTALLLAQGRAPEAAARLEALARDCPEAPAVWAELGRTHAALGRSDAARADYERSIGLDPDQISVWYHLGVLLLRSGDIDGSERAFERCVTLDPGNAMALRVRGEQHRYAYGDARFRQLNAAAARLEGYSTEGKIQLHYALGKAYDDVGELAAAFAHYEAGGRLQRQLKPYRHQRTASLFKLMKLAVGRAEIERLSRAGFPTDKPVFILGMPRSGTSLIEQIIASHPEAYGAGELTLLGPLLHGVEVNSVTLSVDVARSFGEPHVYFPEEIVPQNCKSLSLRERGEHYVRAVEHLAGPGCKRVVDKMPGNYFWTGFVPMIMPGAKIIHSRRHPVETCLSCYRIFFADGMEWSYDLRELGQIYRAYHEHMLFWKEIVPPGIMIDVRYEDVVANLEAEAKRIIAHCNLDWTDACLRFYETERPVKTASYAQVRKPIYTTSVNRWRRYEPYLKPLLDELGDLVQSYENELQAT